MVRSKYEDLSINGSNYRKCSSCGEAKLLNEYNFELRKDLVVEPRYRGLCRTCKSVKDKEKYLKKSQDPESGEAYRRKRSRSAAKRIGRKRPFIPKRLQLACCIKCCKDIPDGAYVYAHEAIGYGVYYIGKGTRNRAWLTEARHKNWKTFTAKRINSGIIVHILHAGLTSEEAYEIEKREIHKRGRKMLGTGLLINLDEGGTGLDPEVMRGVWRERLADPKEFKKASERAKKNFSDPEVRKRALATRQQNTEYIAQASERMVNYSQNPEMRLKATETRRNNPNWKVNVQKGLKEYFKDSNNLERHRFMMRTDEYKTAHAKGVMKNEKSVRMYLPPDWKAPDNYYVEFSSQKQMCDLMNFNEGKVSEVILGKRKYHHGFIFTRVPELDEPELKITFSSKPRNPNERTLQYFELVNSGVYRKIAAEKAGISWSNIKRLEKSWPELLKLEGDQ